MPLRAAGRSLAVALALAIWLPAAAAQPPSASARSLTTGITNVKNEVPLAFERTAAAGARFVRIPLDWGRVAPAVRPSGWRPEDPSDPGYRWDESDSAVSSAVVAGLTPVLQIDGGPVWAQRCESPAFAMVSVCDTSPEELRAFATAAAHRYSGQFAGLPRVQYWQGLNEPNLSLFFNPQYGSNDKPLSPDLYRDLINAFYAGVKSADDSNLVLAAGLGPIAVPPYTIGPMRFARELLCMHGHSDPRPNPGACGGGVRFDIFAIQPYTTGGPTHEGGLNDVQLGDLGKLQTLLHAADQAGRIEGAFKHTPLWITEFSWDSQPPDPGGLPMAIEVRWTAGALHQAWLAGVSHFFWFSLRDTARDPGDSYRETLESGLYFRGATLEEDQPKPVLKAFRFPFVSFPRKGRLYFWGRTPDSGPGPVSIQVWKGRRWQTTYLAHADKAGIFHGTIARAYGRSKRGSVRSVFRGEASTPFSMRPVPDFRHSPFG